jgi:hypothetical protein
VSERNEISAPSPTPMLTLLHSSQRVDHGIVVYEDMMSCRGPCVPHPMMSLRAQSACATEMNVRRLS